MRARAGCLPWQSQCLRAGWRRRLHVLHTIAEVREARAGMRRQSAAGVGSAPPSLGFVPTMGALHAGHLRLVQASQRDNTQTLVSIFVNPTQFLPGEDLSSYPRPLQSDLSLLSGQGVDFAFVPSVGEMYGPAAGPPPRVFVSDEGADLTAEGRVRPSHFRGVLTVCCKLFAIVQPDAVYLGAKDGQQCISVSRMVRELNLPLSLRVVDTEREQDGLAMSSRNAFLTPDDRRVAGALYAALQAGRAAWDGGEREADAIRQRVSDELQRRGQGRLRLQYVSLASMQSGDELHGRLQLGSGQQEAAGAGTAVMLSIAARLGKTRLIDNIMLSQ